MLDLLAANDRVHGRTRSEYDFSAFRCKALRLAHERVGHLRPVCERVLNFPEVDPAIAEGHVPR
jgi:hypothetical protein